MSEAEQRWMRIAMAIVDLGFVVYWVVSATHLVPPEWLYADADDPLVVAWNWSFLPLDLAVSATGFAALAAVRRAPDVARTLTVVSLAFTSASGLNAIAFWAIRGDFDWAWWAPNLALLVGPWWPLGRMIYGSSRGRTPVTG
ncbi:MAG: DUF5360 family protein [Myxococcota bacterium]